MGNYICMQVDKVLFGAEAPDEIGTKSRTLTLELWVRCVHGINARQYKDAVTIDAISP